MITQQGACLDNVTQQPANTPSLPPSLPRPVGYIGLQYNGNIAWGEDGNLSRVIFSNLVTQKTFWMVIWVSFLLCCRYEEGKRKSRVNTLK